MFTPKKVKRLNILYGNTRMFEDYLSSMAEKGYIFKKIIFSDYYVFKRDRPQKIRFFIDYYITNNSDDLNEYIKLRSSQGFKLVYSKGYKHIFKGESNDINIQRDNDFNSLIKKQISESYILTRCLLQSVILYLVALIIKYNIQGEINTAIYTGTFLLPITILSIIKFREYLLTKKVLKGNNVYEKVIITNIETNILIIVMLIIYGVFK